MADTNKATVPEVKAYFGDGGKAVTARDLIDLKKAPSVAGHASAYDDLAFGIGDGSLSY